MTVLHKLVETENDIEKLRKLLKGGENPNIRDGAGYTPLHLTVLKCEGNPQEMDDVLLVARELIYYGADVNLGDYLGITPLHFAVGCRNYKMIELLLHSNAQINQKDNEGYAALHYATSKSGFSKYIVYNTELRVVKLLLKYNPILNIQNRINQTPLMLAVRSNNFQIVHELLKEDEFANLRDAHSNSAMHYALDRREVNVDIVLELVRHGSSFTVSNDSDATPLTFYFRRLMSAPCVEIEKAKYVFKLFKFQGNYFNSFQHQCIKEITKKKDCQFTQFLQSCAMELQYMKLDELAPNYSVYHLAKRGVYCREFENPNRYQLEKFNNVLDKLIKGQYPVYSDLIVSDIYSPFMNKRFAEVCCHIEKSGTKFLNSDSLYLVSFYLSHFDMLNMMIACSGC